MIGLTITDLNNLTQQDAAALRAIADVYHPVKAATSAVTPGTFKVGDLASLGTEPVIMESDIRTPTLDAAARLVGTLSGVPKPTLAEQFAASVKGTAERAGVTAKVTMLHPHDNPAVGAPDQHALADQVFSGGVTNLTSENGDAYLQGIAARSEPDPAQVFSGGVSAGQVFGPGTILGETDTRVALPNVVSGTSTPIPPPLPAATPQTLPQQSPAATNASPPPPPPPAPVPAAASDAAPTTSVVQTDKSGLPWDGRIHAGTKTMTAKGMWTRRRGVEDDVVAQVEQQLRAAMAIPATTAPVPTAWPFPTDSSSVTGEAPPQPTVEVTTFPALMQFITDRIATGRITQEQVQTAVQSTGLESLNLVMARPDLIPAIMTKLREVAP
jgi:hypothetical protein